MKPTILYSILISFCFLFVSGVSTAKSKKARQTIVSIKGEKFLINGQPTYKGLSWQGYPIEGLLMNSRMVQGVFDDLNPETVDKWKYPDTGKWDADRPGYREMGCRPQYQRIYSCNGLMVFQRSACV